MADQSLSQSPFPEPEDKRPHTPEEDPLSPPNFPCATLDDDIKRNLVATLRAAARIARTLETRCPRLLKNWIGEKPVGKNLGRYFRKIAREAKKDHFNFRFVHLLKDALPLLSPCLQLRLAQQLNGFYTVLMQKEAEYGLAPDVRDLINKARFAAHYAVVAGELIPSILAAGAREEKKAAARGRKKKALKLREEDAFNLKTFLEFAGTEICEQSEDWEKGAADEGKSEFFIPELEAWNANQHQPEPATILQAALEGLEKNRLPNAALKVLRKNREDVRNALLSVCFEALDELDRFKDAPDLFPEGNCFPQAYEKIHNPIVNAKRLAELHAFANGELAEYLDDLLAEKEKGFEEPDRGGE